MNQIHAFVLPKYSEVVTKASEMLNEALRNRRILNDLEYYVILTRDFTTQFQDISQLLDALNGPSADGIKQKKIIWEQLVIKCRVLLENEEIKVNIERLLSSLKNVNLLKKASSPLALTHALNKLMKQWALIDVFDPKSVSVSDAHLITLYEAALVAQLGEDEVMPVVDDARLFVEAMNWVRVTLEIHLELLQKLFRVHTLYTNAAQLRDDLMKLYEECKVFGISVRKRVHLINRSEGMIYLLHEYKKRINLLAESHFPELVWN